MSQANPLWVPPRIHGELLKLDIAVAQQRWLDICRDAANRLPDLKNLPEESSGADRGLWASDYFLSSPSAKFVTTTTVGSGTRSIRMRFLSGDTA